MKTLRIIYFLSMASLYAAGRITGRREIFLLFFIMAFVALYAFLLCLWTIFSFSYVQELDEATSVKGSERRLKIGIYNDKPFPFTLMGINVERPWKDAALNFNLSPRSHIFFEVPLYCAYRGVYSVGMTTLEVNDIFGLLRISFDMRRLAYYRQKTLKVYPKLLALPFLPTLLNDSKAGGGKRIRLSEEAGDYSELRAYRPGDAAKRIHWKASVSRRGLFVKSFEMPSESAVMIIIDNSKSAYAFEGGLDIAEYRLAWADLACECAAALATYCLRSGYAVTLADADPRGRALEARTQRDFARIYDRLAVMQFGLGADISERIAPGNMPGLAGYKAVYIISSREDAKFQASVRGLVKEGAGVKCVMPGIARACAGRLEACMPGAICLPVEIGGDVASVLSAG